MGQAHYGSGLDLCAETKAIQALIAHELSQSAMFEGGVEDQHSVAYPPSAPELNSVIKEWLVLSLPQEHLICWIEGHRPTA